MTKHERMIWQKNDWNKIIQINNSECEAFLILAQNSESWTTQKGRWRIRVAILKENRQKKQKPKKKFLLKNVNKK